MNSACIIVAKPENHIVDLDSCLEKMKSVPYDILNPLVSYIEKMEGVVQTSSDYLDETKETVLKITVTSTPTIMKIVNSLCHGSGQWKVDILGTDTPSHILIRAHLSLKDYTWDDFKREIDYKVCLLKL